MDIVTENVKFPRCRLSAAEMWKLTQTNRRRLEGFEMWIWRRMEKISLLNKVAIEEVLL